MFHYLFQYWPLSLKYGVYNFPFGVVHGIFLFTKLIRQVSAFKKDYFRQASSSGVNVDIRAKIHKQCI
jgi:hypothetical protein